MTDSATPRKPAFIIVAAILNFLSCGTVCIFMLLFGFLLVFGNLFGMMDAISNKLTTAYPEIHFSAGANVFLTIAFLFCFAFFIFFLWLGIGLLRGHKIAWYFQVGLSIFGLLGFPVGTVVNVIILFFFFQPAIRDYCKA